MEINPRTKHDCLILEKMELMGGGFASALARAAYKADGINFSKIKNAFPEYWEEYSQFVEEEE